MLKLLAKMLTKTCAENLRTTFYLQALLFSRSSGELEDVKY